MADTSSVPGRQVFGTVTLVEKHASEIAMDFLLVFMGWPRQAVRREENRNHSPTLTPGSRPPAPGYRSPYLDRAHVAFPLEKRYMWWEVGAQLPRHQHNSIQLYQIYQ